jgi:hypothetical protein
MPSQPGVDQAGGGAVAETVAVGGGAAAEAVAVGLTLVVCVPVVGGPIVGARVVEVGDVVMVGIGGLVGALVDAPFGEPEVGRGVYGVGAAGVSLLVLVWVMGVGAATTGNGRTSR